MFRFATGAAAMLVVVSALAASWDTPSFRTANGALVRVGMTRAEVTKSAGEPADKTVISHGVTTDETVGLTRETWTYRTADGTYTLTFAGTKLEKIEVSPTR